jgi:hypothetical protein
VVESNVRYGSVTDVAAAPYDVGLHASVAGRREAER